MRQFNENIKKVVAAINSAPPEQYTFVCESAPKHDGKLTEFYEVRYLTHSHRPGKPHVFIGNGGHMYDHIEIEPSEALSLLAWLRQEEETLTSLAKEQSGDG